MSLSFRCFCLPLLAFLFSLSVLNAGESFAADNAKEMSIKIEELRKKAKKRTTFKEILERYARKTKIGNAFGNTIDANKEVRRTYQSLVDEAAGNMTDPNVGNSSMEAPLGAIGSIREVTNEARKLPGTAGKLPSPRNILPRRIGN